MRLNSVTRLKGWFVAVIMGLMSMFVFTTEVHADGNAVNEATKGVVSIVFYLKGVGYGFYEGNNFQAIITKEDTSDGRGSGFFVGEQGKNPEYVVTNHHVVDDFINAKEGEKFDVPLDSYYCKLDGETYSVDEANEILNSYPNVTVEDFKRMYYHADSCELRVYYDDDDYDIGYVECYGDREKVDLAVLKLRDPTDKRKALPVMSVGDDMKGSSVYCIGFPGSADNEFSSASTYGLSDVSITKGVFSALVRNEKGVERIETDAQIHHGNSGGPMISENGAVIGVDTNVESNVKYGTQVEAKYYALSSNVLIDFLDDNNIPYSGPRNAGGVPVILIIVIVAAAAAVVVIIIIAGKSKKKKNSPTQGNASSASPASAKHAMLKALSPQHNGAAFAVHATPIIIGRDPISCKVTFKEGTPGISEKHCSLSFDEAAGEFILTDLRSSYGTFLMNGQRLNPNVPYKLRSGDGFYVGEQGNSFRVELG